MEVQPSAAGRARAFKTRLLASADNEHEMALNRLVPAVLAVLLNGFLPRGDAGASYPLGLAACYLICAVGLCLHLVLRPRSKLWRRQAALVLDLGAGSYELYAGGEITAWVYPFYLWVVFGNGFRFGPRQLLVAMVLSIAAFGAVIAATPFWSDKPTICAGLLLGQLLIPMYTFSLLDKLSRARQQAVEANRAKSLFLAKVSHELRTPLNAIIGFGALLADEPLDSEQRDMTRTILSSGRSLLSLIDSILDLSRLEAGQMPVSEAEFDLCDLLEDLRRMVLAQAREKRLSVSLHIAVRTPSSLRGDAGRLREILLNLLSNAVKFTESGSIVLAVDVAAAGGTAADGSVAEGAPVGQTAAAGFVRLRFEVDDTGIGIAPEAQGRIFEMFTQADETIANRYGGTGLGLSITKQLVELLGGSIRIDSLPGRGTLMQVELDLALAAPAGASRPNLRAVRCFLVSDNADLAAPLVRRLQGLGVQLDAAIRPGAAEAVAGHAAGSTTFAVIRHSCETPRLSVAALLANDALRFFDVVIPQLPPSAPRGLRRRLTTRVSAAASDLDLVQALRLCGGFDADRSAMAEPAWTHRSQRSSTVLIADDNRVNQKVLTRIMERAGYGVIVAADGDEMLDVLEGTHVDVAVVDVNMPNTNGIEATKILRVTSLGRPRVPVIGVTADATPETRDACLAAGMDVCMLKPVEPLALVAAVDALLAQAGAGGAPAAAGAPARLAGTPREGAVGSFAPHARFRPASGPIIDQATLEDLLALGGESFVADVVNDFLVETDELILALAVAAASGDAQPFRAGAHAIRSGAANIGARQLCQLAEEWQTVSAEQLRAHGHGYVSELTAHVSKLRRSLTAFTSELRALETGL